MASAVLASENESSWAQSGGGVGFMGKIPYLNPNPKKKQKQFHNHQHTTNGRQKDNSPAAVTQTASDDAYSFNQRPIENHDGRNGFNHGGYLSINISSYTKSELNDLRKRLASELEQTQNLRNRIESGQFSTTNNTNSPNPNPRSQPKTWKKLSGSKRPAPSGSNKIPKKSNNGFNNRNVGISISDMEGLMKECRQILTKLMKHKHGWVFNKPVDAAALGLHDYHLIVKKPMDLGTVKSNLAKNFYRTPSEFANDVRLTFNNALLYNPKTDPYHGMADQLLFRFEELFSPIQAKVDSFSREFNGADDLQGSSWNHIPTPERTKKPKAKSKALPVMPPQPIQKKQERTPLRNPIQNHSSASTTPSNPPPPAPPPVRAPSPEQTPSPPPMKVLETVGRVTTMKQPKPRARDPNKRDMSLEEKHKLGVGLQSLPEEKMPQLVQIIRKRNEQLGQEGDEIELDIEALDTETLWELDRFVTNWKKMVSKTKRQGLLMNLNPGNAVPTSSAAGEGDEDAAMSDKNDSIKKAKKSGGGGGGIGGGGIGGDVGEEDVDIDDDMPATNFPPVEIDKDEVVGGGGGGGGDQGGDSSSSSSSSSGSDSSSSSDSDSGSSSGSDSDEDEAQS